MMIARTKMISSWWRKGCDPVVPPPSPTSPFTILFHQFSDAVPGAFLDFGSLRGKDAHPFA
jgi:hypothetical protein